MKNFNLNGYPVILMKSIKNNSISMKKISHTTGLACIHTKANHEKIKQWGVYHNSAFLQKAGLFTYKAISSLVNIWH